MFDQYYERSDEDLNTLEARFLEMEHTYDSACHATAAMALHAARRMASRLGLSGFQAGFVDLQFVSHWRFDDEDVPFGIMDFSQLLYPQYDDDAPRRISKATFERLRELARERLNEAPKGLKFASERVLERWRLIAGGNLPICTTIKEY